MNGVLTSAPVRRQPQPSRRTLSLPGWLQAGVLLLFLQNAIHSHDPVGNRILVIDGNSHTTVFAYDGLNRNTQVTDAAGQATRFAFDALNKTGRTDALGQGTSYLYDARNRLSNVVYASTAAANSQRNYAYDDVGNLLSVTEPGQTAANVAYTYDPLNRAITETSGGLTHAYTYDAAGNRLTTVYGGTGRTIASTYDYLNRLSTMTENSRVTSYGYDLNGNIFLKTLPNGDVETETFDALNRVASQIVSMGTGTSPYMYSYDYDLAGNVTSIATAVFNPLGGFVTQTTTTNTYDAIDRLTVEAVTLPSSGGIVPLVAGARFGLPALVHPPPPPPPPPLTPASTTTYTYDAANNRLTQVITGTGADSVTYTYNNLNELTAYTDGTRSVALSYDVNGNRASRVVSGSSDAGTDTYSYDFENRLISLYKGTAGTGTGVYNYIYDYRTRRVVRDESLAGGVDTTLIFSGGTSVQEYTGAAVSGNLQVEYLRGSDYGGGVGGILYTLRSGTPSYTHENRRGDVVAKTDGSGSLTYQAQYAAFGNQTATSGSTLDRQKSNSKDTDPWGGVNEGYRYRDLETGEFITRDPAGFVDGPNLYTYVIQNPWTKFDAEGLDATSTTTPPPKPAPTNSPPSKQTETPASPYGPHVTDVPQPSQPTSPTSSAKTTQQQSKDAANGGFAQPNADDCVPTATRQVIAGATGKDPGNLDKEEGKAAFGDGNHDWNNGQGVTSTPGNQRDIMKAHGADLQTVWYKNTDDLLGQVGNTPVSVGGTFSNAPPNAAGHQVTISKNPNGDGYVVTNVTGQPGVGGSEVVTRQQVESGQIPVPIGGKVYQGTPTYKIDPGGWGVTATPSSPSSSPP